MTLEMWGGFAVAYLILALGNLIAAGTWIARAARPHWYAGILLGVGTLAALLAVYDGAQWWAAR